MQFTVWAQPATAASSLSYDDLLMQLQQPVDNVSSQIRVLCAALVVHLLKAVEFIAPPELDELSSVRVTIQVFPDENRTPASIAYYFVDIYTNAFLTCPIVDVSAQQFWAAYNDAAPDCVLEGRTTCFSPFAASNRLDRCVPLH